MSTEGTRSVLVEMLAAFDELVAKDVHAPGCSAALDRFDAALVNLDRWLVDMLHRPHPPASINVRPCSDEMRAERHELLLDLCEVAWRAASGTNVEGLLAFALWKLGEALEHERPGLLDRFVGSLEP